MYNVNNEPITNYVACASLSAAVLCNLTVESATIYRHLRRIWSHTPSANLTIYIYIVCPHAFRPDNVYNANYNTLFMNHYRTIGQQCCNDSNGDYTTNGNRLAPIMLLKLPIMLWSNAPIFFLLCSNYAP